MRTLLLVVLTFFLTVNLFAQKNKGYAEKAADLQKEIWGSPVAEFKSTAVPADLSKESAVIIARSYSLSRASGGTLKFGASIGLTTRTTKFSIFHERVKINDKTALENFATLEYQKRLDRSTSQLFARFTDENNTFIGAKVIKPNGKELITNTSEEVLVSNDAKDQKGKLAIPDLQVGDILDYYVCKQDIADKEEGNSYKENDNLIFLVDDYPVLYYSLDFQYNKKIHVKTIYANGAQHFEQSTNTEGDQLLSLKLHNVPKYQSQLWTSPLRQYPYIEIGSAYKDDLDGIIRKNHFDGNAPLLNAQLYIFEHNFNEITYNYGGIKGQLDRYFKGRKARKTTVLDSTLKVLYAIWKYNTFCKYSLDFTDYASLRYRRANSTFNIITISELLTDMKVDYDILMVTSRNSNSLDGVFNYEDFDALIRVNGTKPSYMCFDDVVNYYNEIPERFQGEKVIVLHPKRRSLREYSFTESEGTLPVSAGNFNNLSEQLNITMADAGMQKLKVDRLVKQKGALRADDEKALQSMKDIDAELTAAADGLEIDKRFKNEYISGMSTKKYAEQIQAMLDKDKDANQKSFIDDIKGRFDQEPQEVTNCRVINSALDETNPIFEFHEEFVLDNMVKKAGKNYLVDVGKLTGGFYKLEDKERKRKVDIYMPCARSFKYAINITIPPGYSAKGMEEININKANKTGSFSAKATLTGNMLNIIVTREYTSNFETLSNWPALMEMIDAASVFDSKKILLEKNG